MGATKEPPRPPDRREGRHPEWRNAMVGTLTFLNKEGGWLGTIDPGAAPPEHVGDGKEGFWFVMDRELATVKAPYSSACCDGISDGAWDFVPWLSKNTDPLTLDFYHATGYYSMVSADMVEPGKTHAARCRTWLSHACSRVKPEDGAAAALLKAMEKRRRDPALGGAAQERLDKSITCLSPQSIPDGRSPALAREASDWQRGDRSGLRPDHQGPDGQPGHALEPAHRLAHHHPAFPPQIHRQRLEKVLGSDLRKNLNPA